MLRLSRKVAVGKGERDRPGRSVRRLAEQVRLVHQGACYQLVGGTPAGAVETTALPIFNCIVPA